MSVEFATGCMGLKNAKPSMMKPKSKISAEEFSSGGRVANVDGREAITPGDSHKFSSSKKRRQQLLPKRARMRELTRK